jgi:Zn-dependent peptidase ImmA (M78 family)/DNA-binding XRE family transcriptional regulator
MPGEAMAAATSKRQELPINRDVLVWARERVRLSQDDAAAGAGVKPERLREWEAGEKKPTVKQARKLAEVYDRPFLEFFARERPNVKEPELVPDFRMHRAAEIPKEQAELIFIQSEAEEVRLNAIDLFEMLDETPPVLPNSFYGTVSDDAERMAERARAILDVSVDAQMGLNSRKKGSFLKILRSKFESAGILVLKNGGLTHFDARGICFFASPLPIIVFSNESPGAQAFTLAHELGHIVLRQSAISGAPGSAAPSAKGIEDWCDAFASAFLVPAAALQRIRALPARPQDQISDAELTSLANRFAVSRHAMMIRLVNLGYVRASYYWDVKRPQFLEEEARYKGGGRSKDPYYGSRFRSARGDLYTGLVLEAWASGVITNHNASEFMGIKNLAHLDAIRDRFKT